MLSAWPSLASLAVVAVSISAQGGEGHLVVHVGGGVGAAAAAATAVLKQNVELNEGNEREMIVKYLCGQICRKVGNEIL